MTPLENIAHLSDVPIDVEVELDRKVMTVAQVIALEENSVIA